MERNKYSSFSRFIQTAGVFAVALNMMMPMPPKKIKAEGQFPAETQTTGVDNLMAPDILRGIPVDPDDPRFKSVGALTRKDDPNLGFCTLNNIGDNKFTVAAHCLYDENGQRQPDSNLTMVLNTTQLGNGGITYQHVGCQVHAEFEPVPNSTSILPNDIGVCYPIDGSDTTWLPAAPIASSDLIADYPQRTRIHVAGFGLTEDGNIPEASHLHTPADDIYATEKADGRIEIFAANGSGPTCAGDSGAAGFIQTADGKMVQVYLHNGGHCADNGRPSEGLSTHYYISWIYGVQIPATPQPSATPQPTETPVATAQPTGEPLPSPTPYATPYPTPEPDQPERIPVDARDDLFVVPAGQITIIGVEGVHDNYRDRNFDGPMGNDTFPREPEHMGARQPRPEVRLDASSPHFVLEPDGTLTINDTDPENSIPVCGTGYAETRYTLEDLETNRKNSADIRACTLNEQLHLPIISNGSS